MAVRFGIQIEPQFGFRYDDISAIAREAEVAGFHSLWCSDHFFLDERSQARNCLECWTTLSALARDTETLRLGPLVSCNSYRYPSLLAKTAASVDHLSGGRLEFGIGAGWKEIEYKAYGIPFPTAAERVSRLDEALTLIKAMWTQDQANFKGRYYKLEDAPCAPKPAQRPHPPVWVGGSQPRMLDLMARHADGVNFIPFPTPEQYAQHLDGLKRACQRHARDPETVQTSHFAQIVIGHGPSDVDALLQQRAEQSGRSIEQVRQALEAGFVGTPEQCVEQIKAYTDLGVSQFMLMFPYEHERESLKLVAQHVLPAL